jgi:hypothetical protein
MSHKDVGHALEGGEKYFEQTKVCSTVACKLLAQRGGTDFSLCFWLRKTGFFTTLFSLSSAFDTGKLGVV